MSYLRHVYVLSMFLSIFGPCLVCVYVYAYVYIFSMSSLCLVFDPRVVFDVQIHIPFRVKVHIVA